MKKAIMQKWVDALRSGDYKQGRGKLRHAGNFCCLGVLCNLHAQAHPKIAATQKSKNEYMGEKELLPMEVAQWAGLTSVNGEFVLDFEQNYLVVINDSGVNFNYIANIIEKNWKNL